MKLYYREGGWLAVIAETMEDAITILHNQGQYIPEYQPLEEKELTAGLCIGASHSGGEIWVEVWGEYVCDE